MSQRKIGKRLVISRPAVVTSEAPPSYVRAPVGLQLHPLMQVTRQLVERWPELKAPRLTELLRAEHGYEGSVDLRY